MIELQARSGMTRASGNNARPERRQPSLQESFWRLNLQPIQGAYSTFLFRENQLLSAAHQRLTERRPGRPLRILSFGCSVGDEIFSIRCLFPHAEIVGCDVNDVALAEAQATVGHFATIIRSDEEQLANLGPFDLILACSVLCIHPRPKDFLVRFPPARFEETVNFLDSILGVGGILAITNATYRFHDFPVSAKYDPIRSPAIESTGFVDVMDRHGQPILTYVVSNTAIYFRKAAHFVPKDDEELCDCLFQKRGDSVLGPKWIVADVTPKSFVCTTTYERENVIGNGKPVPDDAIKNVSRYRLGYNKATGESIVLKQLRWKSLAHDGDHLRPEVWLKGLQPKERKKSVVRHLLFWRNLS